MDTDKNKDQNELQQTEQLLSDLSTTTRKLGISMFGLDEGPDTEHKNPS